MSDTPTYDQLSAMCAQLAVALEEMCDASNSAERFRARSNATAALTAYATMSPDPVYLEAKTLLEKASALSRMSSGLDWCDETESARRSHEFNLSIKRARGEG